MRGDSFLDKPADGSAKDAPNGFRSQTVNGTGQSSGSGWNRQFDWHQEQVPATDAWQGNRTGE